jgi:biopolymer transport protein ExbD
VRETPVLIRADRDITVQSFGDVPDLVKNLGFGRVRLRTQER